MGKSTALFTDQQVRVLRLVADALIPQSEELLRLTAENAELRAKLAAIAAANSAKKRGPVKSRPA